MSSVDFMPTIFARVDRHFETKCQAVRYYRAVLNRDYMSDEYLLTRARWWGQVAGYAGELVEPFELVLWR